MTLIKFHGGEYLYHMMIEMEINTYDPYTMMWSDYLHHIM